MAKPEDCEIAYILKGFPRLSETFIANEIHLLETLGMKLHLFSVKGGETDKVHSVVAKIRAPLHYLPAVSSVSGTALPLWLLRNLGKFFPTHAGLLRRRPRAYLTTLGAALAMAWRYRPRRLALRKSMIKEFLQAGYIAARIVERPHIRYLHGHFCHGATTITWFASRLTGLPFSFTAHAKDIYQSKLNPGDLLQRKLQVARFVTTCTRANHEYLRRLCDDPDKIHTIYHGLDTRIFTPHTDTGDAARTPLILAVGRMVEKKGFMTLIEACGILKNAAVRFRCMIVGEDGDQSERLRRRIGELDLADSVTLHHAITQDELRRIYARAMVFALPCQIVGDGDRDGIPNVLVEAMAMQIPVVATPVSGIPELIENDNNGVLVPERNSRALAQALQTLLSDAGLRSRLGEAARAKVCREFDARQTTRGLRDLFLQQIAAADQANTAVPVRRVAI
jgi:glycosyltransferase involved in cell wall biosynthesis